MKLEKIKPIPKYILNRIKQADKTVNVTPIGHLRYYSYLAKNDGELVKVTVAVKHRYNSWHYKQCAAHGVHSDKCFVKDMCFNYIGGYSVGWYEQGLQKYRKWYEHEDWGYIEDKLFDPYAPIVNKEYLAKFSEYRFSAVGLFSGVNIFKYLRLYEQYPQIEYLMKLGLTKLYDSTTILKRIGKDKIFCKWLIKNKDELISNYHYVNVILRAYKTDKPLKALQAFQLAKTKLQHDESLKIIRELFKGNTLERFFLYIAKQNTDCHSYLDYLKACNYLGLDMCIEKNCFPHDFKRWHDIRIDEYNSAIALADEKERKEFYEQFASVANKYSILQQSKANGFVVVIAKSPYDLVLEGKALNHCVGRMNYDQKFVREESLIFFIRKIEDLSMPFVTVEYSPKSKKVLQCYGLNSKAPDESVTKFVNKVWLPYANRTIRKLQLAA